MDELLKRLIACRSCGLCQSRTQVVSGFGDSNAKIILIGEAPGGEEDKLGRPFVGKAGHQLDRFLEATAIPREQLYITNIVKCRPTAVGKRGLVNRKPSQSEIASCVHWLEQEIVLLKPRLIVTLGAVPLAHFVGSNPRVSDYHGRILSGIRENILLFPLYHPAAVIYDRGLKDVYHQDLNVLRETVGSLF